MDDDIKDENVQLTDKRFNSLFEYTPSRPEIPTTKDDVVNLFAQEEEALIRAKKVRENTGTHQAYPWEDDNYGQETTRNTENRDEKKREKKEWIITPARLQEIRGKNKGGKTYVITLGQGEQMYGSNNKTEFALISPPKFSGSIGSVKQYKVSGRPDIFIQEIDPLSIRIKFQVRDDGSFVRRNVGEWIKQGFNNFMNFSYFETKDTGWLDGVPTGQFIANGRNYGAKTNKNSSWANNTVLVIRPGQVPQFDVGSNWYNAGNSNEIFREVTGKDEFISNKVQQIVGESVVAANTPLFFERGIMRTTFSSTLLGSGKYNPRGFIGVLKSGKWFVGSTGGGGDRKSPKNGYDAKDVAEALNKIYVNQIVYAMGTDSGGSTSFVSDKNIIEGSSKGRALPVILSW